MEDARHVDADCHAVQFAVIGLKLADPRVLEALHDQCHHGRLEAASGRHFFVDMAQGQAPDGGFLA